MNTLHISRPSGGVCLMEFDAPPANALDHNLRLQLEDELNAVDADLSIRVVVLTGRGKTFCAGDNLREAQERGDSAMQSLSQFGKVLDKIEGLRVPVIAAVNGAAVGGGLELALCCDIRLGTSNTKFIAAGVNVGLMASVYRLPRLIGIARAKTLLLTGLPTDGRTALDYGLITGFYEEDRLLAEALSLAERIASRAPLSVEATKRQTNRALDISADESSRAAREELSVLTKSNDHRIGVKAFVDRKMPAFTRS